MLGETLLLGSTQPPQKPQPRRLARLAVARKSEIFGMTRIFDSRTTRRSPLRTTRRPVLTAACFAPPGDGVSRAPVRSAHGDRGCPFYSHPTAQHRRETVRAACSGGLPGCNSRGPVRAAHGTAASHLPNLAASRSPETARRPAGGSLARASRARRFRLIRARLRRTSSRVTTTQAVADN